MRNSDTPLTVVVLAGGKGTRLKHLTEEVPKAMIEVAGRPLFHYGIGFAKALGATRIIFSGSHLFEMLSDAVTMYDPSIVMVKDKELSPGKRILGLVSVRDAVEGDIVIFDGDYIYHRDIAEKMRAHDYTALSVHATREQSPYMAQDVIVDINDRSELLNMVKTVGTQPLGEDQVYFNSLFYCPKDRADDFFNASEECWKNGGVSAEDAILHYRSAVAPVDVVMFDAPLWMEVDTIEEREMGEKFIQDHRDSVAL